MILRLNVWRSCLIFSCCATVFIVSPSAHDQSAAALRRPPARHLAALCLFLEALLFHQSSPNRWISRVSKNIVKKNTPGKTGCVEDPARFYSNLVVACFCLQDFLRGELNSVCDGLRLFPSRVEVVIKTDRIWMYSWSTVKYS